MRGVYSHVTERMLSEIRDALQRRWEASLRARRAVVDLGGSRAQCGTDGAR